MKKVLLLLLLLLPQLIFSQNTGKLRGFLSDKSNGEVLAFANVFIKEASRGASTSEKGFYFISSIPGGREYTVVFSYVGYKTLETKIFIAENKITQFDAELEPQSIELATVTKIGKRTIEENETDIGLQRISIRQLQELPRGVETDIFRSIQNMPGVRSTGDISARYYVRGGASNENLVLFNGSPVYNPFHAFGMFSVIDPEIINSVEFYKGGFPAEYGGRLSSVLMLETKDGNKNRFGAKSTVSFLTAKALLEGPIPYGSFMISGRKSHSTTILKKFLNDKQPPFDFYDLSFKLSFANPNFIPGSKFTIQTFASQDKLLNENPLREDFKWNNNIIAFKWFQIYEGPLYSEFDITYSNFVGEVIPNFSQARPKYNQVDDISFRMDFTYLFDSKDEVEFGIKFQSLKAIYNFENQFGINSTIEGNGAYIGSFGKYKFLRLGNFGADVGFRANLNALSVAGDFFIEPRVNLTLKLFPWLKLKAAWGVYQQEITTVSEETEVVSLFEPYIIIPAYLQPSRAIHYIAGFDLYFTEYINLQVESYYKKLKNLTAVNNNKRFIEDRDLLKGDGESYGVETSLKITRAPFNFNASYSLAWAYKEVDGWLYHPRYDARHSLNLTLEYNIGKGWKTSVMWIFGSGLPYTQIIGYYDKLAMGNLNQQWFIYDSYLPYSVLGDKNLGRLPNYHRMDLNISKIFDFSFMKLHLDFSVINLYDRKNIFYFQRDTGEEVNMLPILPTATVKVEF